MCGKNRLASVKQGNWSAESKGEGKNREAKFAGRSSLQSFGYPQQELTMQNGKSRAKGGGWIFQSDHSVSSFVAPESYELALKILRQNGSYPLSL